jgi:iron complex outermembrane receptor protein
VLVNGRRFHRSALLGARGAQGPDLAQIPASAIKRIEVLRDGASAQYGSDAIAGVINFILKKNYQGFNIEATHSQPTQSSAGRTGNFNLTYGMGDLDADRYNVLLSYRKDETKQVRALDRDFADTAYVPFNWNGNSYVYDRTSPAAIPANVSATFKSGAAPIGFNPYQKKNGQCAPMNQLSLSNTALVQNCGFDFVQTIEIVPENRQP